LKKKDLKPIERNTERFNKVKAAMQLAKNASPEVTKKYLETAFPEGIETQTGSPIPVNVSLGEYEDQILHRKVIEYFLNKAGTIVMMDCGCRASNKCENHSIELGCFYLGKGAAEMDLTKFPGARRITKEEALEFERKAYENGLVPHLGKLRADAKAFGIIEYEHEFMSICHCCSCCCVVAIMKYGPSEWKQIVNRTEGVELRVDPDKCTGCGACFKVCIYDALRMEDDITSIKQDNCMGCGRCERECPSEAISITIDYSRIDELFERFDSRVDISG
jgi:Fe-S-cluster-containing hydrogenase component 2